MDFHGVHGTVRFTFVRHGESEANRDGVIQGRIPSRLTELGRRQAAETGAWFRERPPAVILTSPLTRARQTAEIIAAEAGLAEVREMEALTEIDAGIFSGLTRAQCAERHPAEWKTFQSFGWESVPGSEKVKDLRARAQAAWDRLIGLAGEGASSLLCITHSGFLQWMIRSTLGLESWMPLFSTSGNCAITQLLVDNRPQNSAQESYYVNWVMINTPPSCAEESCGGAAAPAAGAWTSPVLTIVDSRPTARVQSIHDGNTRPHVEIPFKGREEGAPLKV